MFKKGFLTVLLVAVGIFAASMAYADQIDGLASQTGPAATIPLYVNPGSLGDALVYGYYNAKAGFNFIRVVNTSTSFGVGAKVRFREGKNSNEVLDFFICLSAGDQWSAWVSEFAGISPARILWWDNDTPTYPDPQGDNDVTNNIPADLLGGSIPFAYSATGAAAIVSLEDTKEGYLEIIGARAWADVPGTLKVVKTPRACGETLGITGVDETAFTAPSPVDVPNSLFGTNYIIKGFGVYPYNATALANFQNQPIGNLGLATDNPPLLSDAADTLLGVNYVLTKTTLNAMYDIEAGLEAGTDVILNFPTKRRTIQLDPGGAANGPFNDNVEIKANGEIANISAADTTKGRCEVIDVTIWDDREARTTTAGCTFSPCTPQLVAYSACNEVTVFTVGATAASVLDSILVTPESQLDSQSFDIGWIQFDLRFHELNNPGTAGEKATARSTTAGGQTATGLPVIGYVVGSFVGGDFASMIPISYDLVETIVP